MTTARSRFFPLSHPCHRKLKESGRNRQPFTRPTSSFYCQSPTAIDSCALVINGLKKHFKKSFGSPPHSPSSRFRGGSRPVVVITDPTVAPAERRASEGRPWEGSRPRNGRGRHLGNPFRIGRPSGGARGHRRRRPRRMP